MSTAAGQYATAVRSSHSGTETVLVGSFSVRRLECSLHMFSCLIIIRFFRTAKVEAFFVFRKYFELFFAFADSEDLSDICNLLEYQHSNKYFYGNNC